MFILNNITYTHLNKDLLFDDINLTINKHDKIALIGNNGVGKSTLLKILSGTLLPSKGHVKGDTIPYYTPQHFGQLNDQTIAQALQVDDKLKALKEILDGSMTEANLILLNDDWTVEERCREALSHWKLDNLDLSQKMETLSGGQKTKVLLSGIMLHQPELVLMDEPSNHLDTNSRRILYEFIETTTKALLVVSHDRTLLNLLDTVAELSKKGITIYGGNYDFYIEQKTIEENALNQDLKSKEKELRKAKEVEREALERKQKLDARGKKKQEKAGLPTISMNTFRNNAEKSTSRIKDVHAEKLESISKEVSMLRNERSEIDQMKIEFDNTKLHIGKKLFTASSINFGYEDQLLWKEPLSFVITSGERISIKGNNGSGKSSLIKIILGSIHPKEGTINTSSFNAIYIDQDYSLVDNKISVYEQAQLFNQTALQEHEIKIRLNRFLFTKEHWDKKCSVLSGGEKMRLLLCCLTIKNQAPDLIVLDEPTNNLDIQNIEILTAAIKEYKGTLLVVSHDEYFLNKINVDQTIDLI